MIYADHDYLVDVVYYCKHKLNIKDDLEINIALCCLKHDGALGWCYDLHENEVDIELDQSQCKDSMMLTLCHEMVHVKQFSEGKESNEEEANNLEQKLFDGFKNLQL